ncbi:MAG: class I SAM-dependent methyltransferase [Phycisphaerae bacterium]|nr:class I SAM-dependent methyltransferase [Phycisphaerae bacterium]
MAGSSLIGRFFKRIHPESIPWPGSVLYNLISSTVIFQRYYEMVTDDILQYCREGRLLDIGTGPARLLLKIHAKAPQLRLVGIDSSPAMVTKAKENITGVESIEIKEGNAGNIPFPDKCFDIVVSTASIHHWKEPAKGLNEVYRVLKNNGFALIYDLVSDTPQSILDDCRRQFGKLKTTLFWLHSFEEPFYSQENFKALAGSALFKDCRTKFLGLLYCLILQKNSLA